MATSTVNSIFLPAEFDSPMHTIFMFYLLEWFGVTFSGPVAQVVRASRR
jgi:hypothetical protein